MIQPDVERHRRRNQANAQRAEKIDVGFLPADDSHKEILAEMASTAGHAEFA